jgi:hypothetical protein
LKPLITEVAFFYYPLLVLFVAILLIRGQSVPIIASYFLNIRTGFIGTGGNAGFASGASVIVNHNYTILALVACPGGTYPHAWCILAMVT